MTEQQTTDGLRQALQELLDALPTGVVLTFGNSPIDHTRLNEAKYKAEQALDAHPVAKAAIALSSTTQSMDIWQAYSAAQDEIANLRAELAVRGCQQSTDGLRQALADKIDARLNRDRRGGLDIEMGLKIGPGMYEELADAVKLLRSLPQPSEARRDALDIAEFMSEVRSRWNFEEHEFDAIEKALSDPECVAALSVLASAPEGKPVAFRWMFRGNGWHTAWHYGEMKPGPLDNPIVEPLYAALPAAKAVGNET